MGLPAIERRGEAQGAGLRLVRSRGPRRRAPRAGRPRRLYTRAECVRCRSAFRLFLLCLALAASVAMVRVGLTAKAAEASAAAATLKRDIRDERMATGVLEVDRSTLSTPSRIAGIAEASLKMTEPAEVRYLVLPREGGPRDAGEMADAGSRAIDDP